MSEHIPYFFTLLGAGTTLVIIGLSISMFWEWVKDQINMAIYSYKRKHRFDKSPTAECYCKDCVCYVGGEYPGCRLNNYKYVEDDFFCKKAEPRKHDPDKKKNK